MSARKSGDSVLSARGFVSKGGSSEKRTQGREEEAIKVES